MQDHASEVVAWVGMTQRTGIKNTLKQYFKGNIVHCGQRRSPRQYTRPSEGTGIFLICPHSVGVSLRVGFRRANIEEAGRRLMGINAPHQVL